MIGVMTTQHICMCTCMPEGVCMIEENSNVIDMFYIITILWYRMYLYVVCIFEWQTLYTSLFIWEL